MSPPVVEAPARPSGRAPRRVAALRIAAGGAGMLLLALAVPSEAFRATLVAGGLGLVFGALFLPSVVRAYGTLAIVVLNTLLFLAAIELVATGVLAAAELAPLRALAARVTGTPNDLTEHYMGLAYYREQPWGQRYWRELRSALRKRYEAYVIWRSPAFSGETIRIDERGIRRTPGADCRPGALRVFVFGGSAIWGWGAPDWATIPAYLQQDLRGDASPLCVVNFGEQAFVSSQGVLQLLMQLQRGDVPDVVLFYDGVNEVLAASQTMRPILHQNYEEIARRFEPRSHSLVDSLAALRTSQVIHRLTSLWRTPPGLETPGPTARDLAEATVDAYLVNLGTVASWAETYGFEYHFFWQPHILIGKKPLSPEEERIATGLDWVLPMTDTLRELFAATHARIAGEALRREHLHDLAPVFDGVESPVWIDTWGHTAPPGNELVAHAIARTVARRAPE